MTPVGMEPGEALLFRRSSGWATGCPTLEVPSEAEVPLDIVGTGNKATDWTGALTLGDDPSVDELSRVVPPDALNRAVPPGAFKMLDRTVEVQEVGELAEGGAITGNVGAAVALEAEAEAEAGSGVVPGDVVAAFAFALETGPLAGEGGTTQTVGVSAELDAGLELETEEDEARLVDPASTPGSTGATEPLGGGDTTTTITGVVVDPETDVWSIAPVVARRKRASSVSTP